jgi:hypothetical protein
MSHLLLLLSFAAPAALAADKTVDDFSTSLTISPIHLAIPLGELQGEFKLDEKIGVAVIGGYGSTEGVALYEVGAQGRYYLLKDFRSGLPLGLELMYVGTGNIEEGTATASATGLTVGPFTGYKHIFDFGLTLEAMAGAAYMWVTGSATDGVQSAEMTETALFPLININIGWSF